MACHAVQSWTLGSLLAAFFDLAIAYFLLCLSAATYFASKFLGFFCLRLPCPCDGLFFNIRSKSLCLNTLLVEFPTQIVSYVRLSVKDNFHSHGCITKNRNYGTLGEICVDGYIGAEGEASCSSVSDGRKTADVIRIEELNPRAEKYDLKGKGVTGHRPRSRFRRLRKGNGGLGKNSAAPAYDSPIREVEPYSHSRGNELVGDSSLIDGNAAETHYLEYDDKASTTMGVLKRAVTGVEINPAHDEDIMTNEKTLSTKELQQNRHEAQTFSGDDKSTIRLLEQRLEEERIARAALYIELEKERSAAASAADEAMAMILRLQEEKASIEMEARQYQRILEEKSVYDDEEMTLLKEILVRREMEKLFLEKEVEAYRGKGSAGNEQVAGGGSDTILIPHKLQGSIERTEPPEIEYSDGVVSVDYPTSKFTFTNESSHFKKQGDSDGLSVQMSVCSSVGNMDLQEKEIISVDDNLQLTSEVSPTSEKGSSFEGQELEQIQEQNSGHGLTEKLIVNSDGTGQGDWCSGQQTNDAYIGFSSSCDTILDKDSQVHDVHIDGINLCSQANPDKNKQLLASGSSRSVTDFPSSSGVETELNLKKSNSEISRGFPPTVPRAFSVPSDLRQRSRSLTPVDREMVKIKSEVGWLQERLKLVQEGRGKLSLSGENQERENTQLKLLEDIARQVEEIRYLTETKKAARQVSLPLPTSKGASKKRRSRSVSSGGFQISSEGEHAV